MYPSPRPADSPSGKRAGRGDVVSEGVVLESVGGVYSVALDEGGEVDAFLRGRLKQVSRTGDRIVPGDRVLLGEAPEDEGPTIEAVLPRDNELVRTDRRGRKAKVVVANLDRVAIVLSVDEPPFGGKIADRFLALAEVCRVPPLLVLNKVDLSGSEDVVGSARELYDPVGYPVIATSASTGEGLDALSDLFHRGTSAMIGPSGVGKSSLLNVLLPDLELRTAPVARKGGQGRHTTVGARLIRFSRSGWIADTPGFSEVALWNAEPGELSEAFPEFLAPAESCRFRGCTHSHEPDCGVRTAVADGRIDRRRYESYLTLLSEVSD